MYRSVSNMVQLIDLYMGGHLPNSNQIIDIVGNQSHTGQALPRQVMEAPQGCFVAHSARCKPNVTTKRNTIKQGNDITFEVSTGPCTSLLCSVTIHMSWPSINKPHAKDKIHGVVNDAHTDRQTHSSHTYAPTSPRTQAARGDCPRRGGQLQAGTARRSDWSARTLTDQSQPVPLLRLARGDAGSFPRHALRPAAPLKP